MRAEVGYPPLVTPLSQIVGTQAVLNVLTGKRWSIVPQRDEGLHQGATTARRRARCRPRSSPACSARRSRCRPTCVRGRMATAYLRSRRPPRSATWRTAKRTCSCTRSSRTRRVTYLTTHKEGAEKAVFLHIRGARTPSGRTNPWTSTRSANSSASSRPRTSSEVVVEENGTTVTVRKGGFAVAQPVGAAAASGAGAEAAAGRRRRRRALGPAPGRSCAPRWSAPSTASPAPGSAPFAEVGDAVDEGQPSASSRL